MTEKEALAAKADEEKAFRTKTGADFGFKKMRGEPDWLKGVLLANATDIRTPNCQRCVVTFEARMRGYDVVARPSWGAGDHLRHAGAWIEAFEYSYNDFKNCAGKTGEEVIKSVEEIMRSFGEDSRALIVFKWDKNKILDSTEGHALVAQCLESGKVNVGDPQTGERAAAWKLKLADLKGGVILLRTDDLKFTDTVKRCCKNRGE